jgi:uncharacterized membrane protein
METKKKAFLKTITWRIIALTISISFAYLFTKKIGLSIGLSLTTNCISMIAYYFHERLWKNYK